MFANNSKRLALAVGLAAWALLAPGAQAQDQAAPARDGNVTSYEFQDEAVHGDTYSPGMEVLHARTRDERNSLIRVRTQFIAELLKSVERL